MHWSWTWSSWSIDLVLVAAAWEVCHAKNVSHVTPQPATAAHTHQASKLAVFVPQRTHYTGHFAHTLPPTPAMPVHIPLALRAVARSEA